jgi:hypothetical protein
MSEFIPTEKGVPIRQPSTANLMIDSADRADPTTGSFSLQPSAFNFQIQRSNALMNGFFTRIGISEVVMEWSEPNIRYDLSNNFIKVNTASSGTVNLYFVDISGVNTFGSSFYNVAECLDAIVATANAAGTVGTWSVVTTSGVPTLTFSVGVAILDCALARQLGLSISPSTTIRLLSNRIITPDLRQYRYIDITCDDLTYNQELKDSSTAPSTKNVLNRWYFAWDNPATDDKYGFPIEMGYNEFVARRIYNPPKQIKWSPNQPLGNLRFTVYGDDGLIVNQYATPSARTGRINYNTNWLATLQVSEV